MKKNSQNNRPLLHFLYLLFIGILYGQSPQSGAPWIVSSAPYPDLNASMPQVAYTRQFRHINLPDFWISKLNHPDLNIINSRQIKQFNTQTAQVKKLIFPPQDFNTTYDGNWVREKLTKIHTFLSERAFYLEDGKPIGKATLPSLWENVRFDAVPDRITARYALVVAYANHRLTPSSVTMLKEPQQHYFDRNQNAALDIGTALAVLHQSTDKKWYFALSKTSYGWVRAEDIALTTREKMLEFTQSKNFVVTINPKNALFIDSRYEDFVRMGIRLPYIGKAGKYAWVHIPQRDKNGSLVLRTATIKQSDICQGYLPYTQRTIMMQAFKFLNAPYGWGGMFGEQDCSKFLQEVYATVGITLPRNSGEQAEALKPLITFEGDTQKRVSILTQKGEPGSTLLHLPGHIMLYLGTYQGAPYMIHTVWGAVEGENPLAKTAVTTVYFKNYIDQMDTAISVKP